ncbi:MAG: hypothetical protein CSYNP_04428 [Syntrophus sp. SKADARSKE-3]|nr:hypothetical protein [Syntrophus sp. SKADARSKE-3]
MDQDTKTSTGNWRTAGGALFTVLIILAGIPIYWADIYPSIMELHPWLKYVFLAVLIAAAAVFFVIRKKEYVPAEHEASDTAQSKKKVHFLFRIIAGLLGIILLSFTVNTCLTVGFRGWLFIMLIGGYSTVLLWTAIKGKRSYPEKPSCIQGNLI